MSDTPGEIIPEEQKAKKADTVVKNTEAEKELKDVSEVKKNPKGTWRTVDATAGGTEQVNITTLGPTWESNDAQTRITGGVSSVSQRPDPGMQEKNHIGLGVSVNTTPEAVGKGIKKIGKWAGNIFKKKK